MNLIDIPNDCNQVKIDFEFLVNNKIGGYISAMKDNAVVKSVNVEVTQDEIQQFETSLKEQGFQEAKRQMGQVYFVDYRR